MLFCTLDFSSWHVLTLGESDILEMLYFIVLLYSRKNGITVVCSFV